MERSAVLITGGARRIGAVMVRAFSAAGWHVVVHYHNSADAAQALVDALPSAELVACDLADTAAAVAMVETLAQRLPQWRALVNSAAVFPYDGPHALSPQIFAEAMAVNALAPIRMTQAFLEAERVAGISRRVIQLTDMKITNTNPDFFSYTMAKQAVATSVKMLASAISQGMVGEIDDRIYGLAPGAMLPSYDQNAKEHETSGRMNLLGRLTQPLEIADAVLFLADGALANGSTLYIDSGQHLLRQPRDVLYLARALASENTHC